VLAATLSSNVGIYGPAYELLDHEPYPGKEENNHSEKYQLKAWDLNKPGNIKAEIARVNAIRNNHEAFQRTFNVQFIPCSNSHIIAYLKQNFDKTDRFIVVVNMDWENKQVATLDLTPEALGFNHEGSLHLVDQFAESPKKYTWHDKAPYLELNPLDCPAHIFQIVD
jgi:starch synthase (maltosyl-transferring)